ncbi:MAG: hypothetical protein RLZZ271_926 [Pseudomonadota bacterium]|jgi:hypothetical protein
MFRQSVFIVALVLAGCASVPDPGTQTSQPATPPVGIDGVACVGQVPTAVAGLLPVTDAVLVAKAQMKTGAGGVCTAQAFKADAPVKVYRVFDGSKSWTAMGGWWALTKPQGPRDAYRELNAICPSWSALDQLVACEVKPGSSIVLGTTQSVDCPDGKTYPKTAEIQVYMANNSQANQLYVENCQQLGAWPSAQ